MLLELGIPRGLLVDWCLLGILGYSGRTLALGDNEAGALARSNSGAVGSNRYLFFNKWNSNCSLLGRQHWDCILMIPAKIREVRETGMYGLAYEHKVSESDIIKLADHRGERKCLQLFMQEEQKAFYLFCRNSSGCLESLEAYLSIFY